MDPVKQALSTKFDKLSPGDFQKVHGDRDALASLVAEKYGISKDEAAQQVKEAFASAGK